MNAYRNQEEILAPYEQSERIVEPDAVERYHNARNELVSRKVKLEMELRDIYEALGERPGPAEAPHAAAARTKQPRAATRRPRPAQGSKLSERVRDFLARDPERALSFELIAKEMELPKQALAMALTHMKRDGAVTVVDDEHGRWITLVRPIDAG